MKRFDMQTDRRETFCGAKFVVAALFVACVFSTSLIALGDDVREWVDSTGKHKIVATLVSHDDAKVKLRREDGRMIEMPISKLSDKDRAFLKGESDDSEGFEADEESKDADSKDHDSNEDALKEDKKEEEVVEELSDVDFSATTEGYSIVGSRLPIRGFWDRTSVGGYERAKRFNTARPGDAWIYRPKKLSTTPKNVVRSFSLGDDYALRSETPLGERRIVFDVARPNAMYVGIGPATFGDLQDGKSYIARCDLKNGDFAVASVPYPSVKLLDVSPDGNYALSKLKFHVGDRDRTCFLLITPLGDLGTKDELENSTLFSPNYREEYNDVKGLETLKIPEVEEAYWIDSNSIITHSSDGVVAAWNLPKGQAVYWRNVGEDAVILDSERKVYVTANDSFVCVYNIKDGKSLGCVSLNETNVAATMETASKSGASAAFSPDGLKLAVVGGARVAIVDMEKGKKLTSFPIDGRSKPDIVWGADDYLIVDKFGYDLKSRLPICRYSDLIYSWGNLAHAFGQPWAVAKDFTLLSFDAPHAAARKIMQGIKPSDYFDVYPDCPFSIKLELNDLFDSNEQKKIEEDFKQTLERNGFKFDPKSNVALVARCVDSGRTEETTFVEVETTKSRGMPSQERVTKEKKAAIKIYEQSIAIEKNGRMLWSVDDETVGRLNATRDEKKSVSQQIKEMNMPEVDFYLHTPLPQFIGKPEIKQDGAPTTATLTSTGLEE